MKILSSLLAAALLRTTTVLSNDVVHTSNSNQLATGLSLLNEMKLLQESLSNLQVLLQDEVIRNDEEVMNKAAKLFRRARWLVYSGTRGQQQRGQVSLRGNSSLSSKAMRGPVALHHGIGSGEAPLAADEGDRLLVQQQQQQQLPDDVVARNLYDAVRSNLCIHSGHASYGV
jgi:hypothetical protein